MFDVVSIHFTRECNLSCAICYRKKQVAETNLGEEFFIEAVPYLALITKQCALGGGEPFLKPDFVKRFARECRRRGVVCNATTNGIPLAEMTEEELREVLKDVTMVSVSYDKYKIRGGADRERYKRVVAKIKSLTSVEVGANILLDESMVEDPAYFVKLVRGLYGIGVDRVFVLTPKQTQPLDVLRLADYLKYLTIKMGHFYVDDLTGKVVAEGRYRDWKTPCHHGINAVSIREDGGVAGCSFDEEPEFYIAKPADVALIPGISFERRYECPHFQAR